MTFDTDEKLESVRAEMAGRIDDRANSSERRITDLYRQNREDFADLRSLMKDTNARILDTQLEVAEIKIRIEGLCTKTQLMETVGTIREWTLDQMQNHLVDKHKSKPPNQNGNKLSAKTISALVAAVVALTGVITVLIELAAH